MFYPFIPSHFLLIYPPLSPLASLSFLFNLVLFRHHAGNPSLIRSSSQLLSPLGVFPPQSLISADLQGRSDVSRIKCRIICASFINVMLDVSPGGGGAFKPACRLKWIGRCWAGWGCWLNWSSARLLLQQKPKRVEPLIIFNNNLTVFSVCWQVLSLTGPITIIPNLFFFLFLGEVGCFKMTLRGSVWKI